MIIKEATYDLFYLYTCKALFQNKSLPLSLSLLHTHAYTITLVSEKGQSTLETERHEAAKEIRHRRHKGRTAASQLSLMGLSVSFCRVTVDCLRVLTALTV